MSDQIDENSLLKEAALFSQYLIGEGLSEEETGLYVKAHQLQTFELSNAEKQAILNCVKFPVLISFYDAGFSLLKSQGGFKKKLYVLLAILEASPFHYSKFFPKVTGNNYFLIFFYGSRAIARALVGFVLVKIVIKRHG